MTKVEVRKDAKLNVYRHFMEKAMEEENWEKFEFWEKAYDAEWRKLFSTKKEKRVDNKK